MTNEQQIAKDFVCAFIASGQITSQESAVDSYYEMLSLLDSHAPAVEPIEPDGPTVYDPFENM